MSAIDVKVVVVTYTCSKCGAIDHDKLFYGESPVAVINCWSCGAGRGLEPKDMMIQRRGMFPTWPPKGEEGGKPKA